MKKFFQLTLYYLYKNLYFLSLVSENTHKAFLLQTAHIFTTTNK